MPPDEPFSPPAAGGRGEPSPPSLLARGMGVVLLLGAYLPLHRLLAPEHTGPAGDQTRAAAEAAWASGLLGTILVLVGAVALARLLPSIDPGRRALEVGARLAAIPARRFAVAVSALALAQGLLVAWAVHGAAPTSVDEMVQLLHARALLEGGLTLPLEGPRAAWATVNGVLTDGGWTSIYPPLHTIWLALWLAVGLPWLAGPVATAVGAGLTALAADEVMEETATARLGGLLVAFSPYLLLLGGTQLSHATAMALLAGAVFCGARATRGRWLWAVAAGACVGAAVCTRPWTGMVTAAAVLAVLWLPGMGRRGTRWSAARLGGLGAGGLPFAAFLFWWNDTLFGHPLRLGYSAAFGPAHGLGFHADPWGNRYGPLEALAYSGADLTQLGAHLLQTPLPALAWVGAALLVVRWKRGSGIFLAWGAAGVAANALYWHHGVHMGPRLLFETAPAWLLLWAASATALSAPGAGLPSGVRRAAGWGAVLSLVGAAALAPGVMAAYGANTGVQASLPEPPGDAPAVVFLHGSWSSRVASRLDALGMRRDSVETALRRNGICSVDRYTRARTAGEGPALPPLRLEPRPGTAPGLQRRLLSPGNAVRVDPDQRWDEACLREARSDRLGTTELEPLAWRSRPRTGRVLLARDLGPSLNASVLEAHPHRSAWFWIPGAGGGSELLPYDEGAELLWGGAAGLPGGGGSGASGPSVNGAGAGS